MKLKRILFAGIILLIVGIVLRKTTPMETLGLVSIITGVAMKTFYIVIKIKQGDYKPGKELILLIVGLLLFFTGLRFRTLNQPLVEPIYLIVTGITLKVGF